MQRTLLFSWSILTVLVPTRGGVQGSTAYAAGPDQGVRACQNVQLVIRPYTSQGAAGHIGVIYRIHNLTARSCTLYGYPGVQLLDRNFLSLPTRAHRGVGIIVGPIPPRIVRLGARGNAYFALGYSDVPVNNRPCPTAYYLMIFPPNDFLPVVTYAAAGGGITACRGALDLSPVTTQPRFR